jgi:hypothetical protein
MNFGPPTILPNGLRLGTKWECLNDGTCGPTDDPGRGKWTTYDDCFKQCGQGKWECVISKGSGVRAGAKHCTPHSTGTITSADGTATTCEAKCKG